jgi:hypothetical protein
MSSNAASSHAVRMHSGHRRGRHDPDEFVVLTMQVHAAIG